MPILQIKSPGDIPSNGLAVDGGSVYAVRVVQFSAGATIAFDDPQTKRLILGYFAYRNAKDPGWKKIWLTGSCIIEVATSPEESFGGSGVAGVNAIDQNQNAFAVGADVSRATYSTTVTATASNDTFVLRNSGAKVVRIREVTLRYPGKQTAAASGSINMGLATWSSGASSSGTYEKHDPSDAAASSVLLHNPVVTGFTAGDFFHYIVPAADTPSYVPVPLLGPPLSESLYTKPYTLRSATDCFVIRVPNFGAGYDTTMELHIAWTEE